MALGRGQDPTILEVANQAAEQAFRMVIDALEVDPDTGIIRVQGIGPGGAPIQAAHLDMAFPFGHYALPPKDVEGVVVPGDVKAAVVATRDPALPADLKPNGAQAMAGGESVGYSRGGVFSKRGASRGRLGKAGSGATAFAVARKTDAVTDTGGAFAAWAAVVEAAFVAPLPVFPPASKWAVVGPRLGAIDGGSANWDSE